MNKLSFLIVLFLLTLLTGVGAAAAGDAANPILPDPLIQSFKAGELLVRLRAGVSSASAEALMERHDAGRIRFLYQSDVELWQVPAGSELSAASVLNVDPAVVYAEPNYLYHASLTLPNDTHRNKQWAHTLINSYTAWDITTGSNSITIAIIDTGVDTGHPDLAAKLVAGWDFVEFDDDPTDLNGHGTHCAGIAAAITNNNAGIVGMDWNAKIMPVRVLDQEYTGTSANITSGITWAAENGADVISLSLVGTSPSQPMQDAVTAAHDAGILLAAAMGNARMGGNTTQYPAAYEDVMAVAATTVDDDYAGYSQYGPHCDIAAPGGELVQVGDPEGIYSTMPTYPFFLGTEYGFSQDYDFMRGTSMATPHVAGLAALMWSAAPTLTPDQVQSVIQDTAVDLGAPGWDQTYGHGRIDASAALLLATSPPSAPVLHPISNPDLDGSYTVDWDATDRTTSYLLQEDDAPNFPSPSQVFSGAATQCHLTGREGATWYYRVRGNNSHGDGPWSDTRSIEVGPPAPTLNTISNPGELDAYTISWSAVPGATGYSLEEAPASGFTTVITRYVGSALSYPVTGQPNGTWFYRLRAYNSVAEGPWSSTESTTVASAVLNAPSMLPVDNDDGDGDYAVGWTAVTGATDYVLEESSEPFFVSPTEVYSGTALSFPVTGRVKGSYYYRVRATSAGGRGPWAVPASKAVVLARVYLPLVLRN